LGQSALEREVLAAALRGERIRPEGIVRRITSRGRIEPSDANEQRMFAAILLNDPAGTHLPLPLRLSLARTCGRLPWPEVARCARSTMPCTDAELDRLLAEAGATVNDRLALWGLTPA
jgi:hypothetical protein